MNVVTRFAPSPTGQLHIGGARTAIFNWLLARQAGGRFVLRIEDTDTQRSVAAYTDGILASMTWLGLDWDGEPIYQSQRFDVYNAAIDRMVEAGTAYWCSCSPEEVDAMRETARAQGRKPKYDGRCRERGLGPGPGRVVRLKAPLTGVTLVDDLIRGPVSFDNAELDDMILRRSDNTPTYNLAVVVDDAEMGITHVVRGDDHLNNTPKQILIYKALGLALPAFGHVPMILGPDKKKLSKRHGATAVFEYSDEGILPEAMLNYLVRLGWAFGDQEIFTKQQLLDAFSIKALGASASVFDREKLLWLNQHYIKEAPLDRLAQLLAEALARRDRPGADQEYLKRFIPLLQPRSRTIVEMAEQAEMFVDDAPAMDPQAQAKFLTEEVKPHLAALAAIFQAADDFRQEPLEAAAKAWLDENGLKFKAVAQPLRVALTGRTASPGLFEMIEAMGKERVLERLGRL
ncbi:Glutamate--tRNA ligase [Fundidesulfovibrio magnetotacticus]|uniref:Glutamate--tRNA ligase n=1 Tax=Fundidesulfovibrio magnetotacticus TaxID=2730080 RepID=A0A6V8LV33_9BACT|nr:glutamate--tRNA ligase [Fundidesulfovibrio magnetotacticus]GFK95604.1 Glutamate--tRNA ligase [Fundidesulfovibrio magnetotacticus]